MLRTSMGIRAIRGWTSAETSLGHLAVSRGAGRSSLSSFHLADLGRKAVDLIHIIFSGFRDLRVEALTGDQTSVIAHK